MSQTILFGNNEYQELTRKSGMYGKHHSEETKRKISKTLMGRGLGKKGHRHTEETKRKISLARIGTRIGSDNPFFGKKHTKEVLRKIIEANSDEKSPVWKGDNVGYDALHDYVKSHNKKSKQCQKCKEIKRLDLANVTGIYNRDIKNYKWLCRKCHRIFDTARKKIGRKCMICSIDVTIFWCKVANEFVCKSCFYKTNYHNKRMDRLN